MNEILRHRRLAWRWFAAAAGLAAIDIALWFAWRPGAIFFRPMLVGSAAACLMQWSWHRGYIFRALESTPKETT